jgi:hypothetical protein
MPSNRVFFASQQIDCLLEWNLVLNLQDLVTNLSSGVVIRPAVPATRKGRLLAHHRLGE